MLSHLAHNLISFFENFLHYFISNMRSALSPHYNLFYWSREKMRKLSEKFRDFPHLLAPHRLLSDCVRLWTIFDFSFSSSLKVFEFIGGGELFSYLRKVKQFDSPTGKRSNIALEKLMSFQFSSTRSKLLHTRNITGARVSSLIEHYIQVIELKHSEYLFTPLKLINEFVKFTMCIIFLSTLCASNISLTPRNK